MELVIYQALGIVLGYALLCAAFLCALWFYCEIDYLRHRVVYLEDRLDREQQRRRSAEGAGLRADGWRGGRIESEYGRGRR